MAIHSAVCSSISDVGGYTHIELTCANGMTMRLMFKSDEPCPYQFRAEYSIEIAPVITAIRQIGKAA